MRWAAPWRAPPTGPESSSAPSTPARDRPCAPPARRQTASSTGRRSAQSSKTSPTSRLFQQEAARPPGRRTDRPRRGHGHGHRFSRRPSVVLTVGTFLGGRIHVGLDNYQGGRAGDPPSNRLAGAPARAAPAGWTPEDRHAAADRWPKHRYFEVMTAQPGDTPVPVFSFLGRDSEHPRQVNCFITKTNERTHEIIRRGHRPLAACSRA